MSIIHYVDGEARLYTLTGPAGKIDAMPTSHHLRFQDGTGYLLAIVGAASRRRWMGMLAQLDMTPTQFKVIMSLAEVHSAGQRQLAEIIGVDPRNCVPIIDSLVESDLLARKTDSADRRRRLLRLTARGRRLAQELESLNTEIEEQLLSPLSRKGRADLRRLLTSILESSEPDT